jgi:hypothetical protein
MFEQWYIIIVFYDREFTYVTEGKKRKAEAEMRKRLPL